MQLNSKIVRLVKQKLRHILMDKEIIDVVLFGSAVKGKAAPQDIDVAVIGKLVPEVQGFHFIFLKPEDFVGKTRPIIATLLREGWSLKTNEPFSKKYGFVPKVLYAYELSHLPSSTKVRIVNALRGKGQEKGVVEQNSGVWLANSVFMVPPQVEYIFNRFFINFGVKFKKWDLLIH